MEIRKAKPTIATVAITLADTEYSYTLPQGTHEFWLKLRDPGYPMQACMVSGETGTTYFTVSNGKIHKETNVKSSNVTIYFRSPQASMTAEIISFK